MKMCPPEKTPQFSSYQELCLSSRSRKIQRLLGFSSAVEISSKNATDGLDRREIWNRAIPASYESFNFFWTFSIFFYRPMAFLFSFASFFVRQSAMSCFIISTTGRREDDFASKTEPDSAEDDALSYLSEVEKLFFCLPCAAWTLSISHPTSTVNTLQKTNIKSMNHSNTVVLEGGWQLFRHGPRIKFFDFKKNFFLKKNEIFKKFLPGWAAGAVTGG